MNIKDPEDKVRSLIEEQNLTMPMLMDKTGYVMEKFGVYGLPTTFIIDREGNVRSRIHGNFFGKGTDKLEKVLGG